MVSALCPCLHQRQEAQEIRDAPTEKSSVELSEHTLIKANNPFTWVAGGRFIYTRGFDSTFSSFLKPSVILPFAVIIMRKIREVDRNGAISHRAHFPVTLCLTRFYTM